MKKRSLLFLLIGSLSTFTVAHWLRPVTAQNTVTVRRLKVDLPTNALITITAVRNLQGNQWWKNFEIEVKNTGDKPIYYIDFRLIYPNVFGPMGRPVGVPLRYGRSDLLSLSAVPTANDVPIKPGESYVFKIAQGYWPGLEHQNSRTDVQPDDLAHMELHLSFLRFGDGTGLNGDRPVKLRNVQASRSIVGKQGQMMTNIKRSHVTAKRSMPICDCQCSWLTFVQMYRCYGCDYDTTGWVNVSNCDDTEAQCSESDYFEIECHAGEDTYWCQYWYSLPCI